MNCPLLFDMANSSMSLEFNLNFCEAIAHTWKQLKILELLCANDGVVLPCESKLPSDSLPIKKPNLVLDFLLRCLCCDKIWPKMNCLLR